MSTPVAATKRHIPRSDRWLPMSAKTLSRVPDPAREWVGWPDSLTERLTHYLGGPVQVRVISERHGRLLADERDHLQVISRLARIREVRLEVGGVAYLVARTVFPDATARVMNNALRELGNRSLGSLLFGPVRAPVSAREFICLEPQAALWRTLRDQLPTTTRGLWARRALHRLDARALLVTEIFLPALWTKRVAHDIASQPDANTDLPAALGNSPVRL